MSGLEKLGAMQSLLRDDVNQIATMWAIPHKAWVQKSRPFDGDNMFHGLWVGDGKLTKRGTRVAVKAFCGPTEIKEYETEVKCLNVIRNVPHTQRLIVAKRQPGAVGDVGAIVSLLQEGTSKSVRRMDDLRTMGRQMLQTLIGLHDIRIIHRDIKPSNILWNSTLRQATLIDFGLATEGILEKLSPSDSRKFSLGSTTVVTSDGIVGTVGYQAPELLTGNRYTSKIDVYSLGMTLSNLVRDAEIDDCETLTDVVRHMTNPEPSERFTASVALQHAFFAIEQRRDTIIDQQWAKANSLSCCGDSQT
jgi:hypothetical protein